MKKHGITINHLEEILDERGISKNQFCHMAKLERTQLNRICKNEITRFDFDVFSRICEALHCDYQSLLEFVSYDKLKQALTIQDEFERNKVAEMQMKYNEKRKDCICD